jgi:hypothetical protein
MRLIVWQIISRVNGSATRRDGLIGRHFELGERQTAQAWHLEYTGNFRRRSAVPSAQPFKPLTAPAGSHGLRVEACAQRKNREDEQQFGGARRAFHRPEWMTFLGRAARTG